jgi:hypothetical protein
MTFINVLLFCAAGLTGHEHFHYYWQTCSQIVTLVPEIKKNHNQVSYLSHTYNLQLPSIFLMVLYICNLIFLETKAQLSFGLCQSTVAVFENLIRTPSSEAQSVMMMLPT